MGRMKDFYYDQLLAAQEKLEACSCPLQVQGMDSLCPHCLAEYEQELMDNYESLADEGLVLIEDKTEREIFEASRKKA